MTRLFLWAAAGIVLGGIIHIGVILNLPALATESLWQRTAGLDATNRIVVLAGVKTGDPNPLALDPELTYALCRIDLASGPGFVRGTLPLAFWSVAVYEPNGTILYSTTNRDGIGRNLELGIFNAVQTRLLAEQQLDAVAGSLIVESPVDDVLVAVRLAPPHQAMRGRYEQALGRLACGNLSTS